MPLYPLFLMTLLITCTLLPPRQTSPLFAFCGITSLQSSDQRGIGHRAICNCQVHLTDDAPRCLIPDPRQIVGGTILYH
jgi:hypothetical protein